jgi:cold-inducible RNA-binding protein
MNIYVGNLSFKTSNEELQRMFEAFGSVRSASVVMDRETGRSRGFGFVEMGDNDGQKAIDALNGKDVDGRRLTVNEARPRAAGGGPGGPPRSRYGMSPGRGRSE